MCLFIKFDCARRRRSGTQGARCLFIMLVIVIAAACASDEDEKTGTVTGTLTLKDDAVWPAAPWQLIVEAASPGGDAVSAVIDLSSGKETVDFRLSDVPVGSATEIAVVLRDSKARQGTLGSRIVAVDYGGIETTEGETALPEKQIDVNAAFAVSYEDIQTTLFEPSCNACHFGGSGMALELDEASSYDALVNTAAVGEPSMRLVSPGDPASSYLISVFGDGGTHSGRISDGQLALLIAWIERGAPNDASE